MCPYVCLATSAQYTVIIGMVNLNINRLVAWFVTSEEWAVLVEDNGKTYVVELTNHQQKLYYLLVWWN